MKVLFLKTIIKLNMKNELFLIGNIGTDPIVNEFKTLKIRLVTKDRQIKKNGEIYTQEEWHSLVFKGKVAEAAARVVKKGMQLYIEGKVHYSCYENTQGKHVFTVILVQRFQRLCHETTQQSHD